MIEYNLFQLLIEFSKLTDLEKKYLSCGKKSYEPHVFEKEIFDKDLTEVQKSLIEKGWLRHYGVCIGHSHSWDNTLRLTEEFEILFKSLNKLEKLLNL